MQSYGQATTNLAAEQIYNTQNIHNISYPAAHDDDPLKLLRDLQVPTAAFDSAGRCAELQCHKETRKVIKKDLTSWVDSAAVTEPNLKWVNGSVGVGKSAVAKWMAEYYKERLQLAASFFFFRQGANHIGNFIPTIAYQIAVSRADPIARLRIIEHIRNDPNILTKSFDVQWKQLIIEPLASIQRPVLIVIDGIDEITSPDEQMTLLRCILHTSLPNPFIKILLVSRPEPRIHQEFNAFGLSWSSRISLGASKEDEADLRTFLGLSLAQVHRLRQQNGTMTQVPSPWPPPDILDKLVRMADCQFIYATTLVSFIDDKNRNPIAALELILQRSSPAFSSLDRLYLTVMERVRDETPKQDRQLLQNLLTHATLSQAFDSHCLPSMASFWSTDSSLIQIVLERLESVLINDRAFQNSPQPTNHIETGNRITINANRSSMNDININADTVLTINAESSSFNRINCGYYPSNQCRITPGEEIAFRHRSFIDFMFNPSFPHPFIINRASFSVVAQRTLDILGDPSSDLFDWAYDHWIGYCTFSLPTPRLLLQVASLGFMPWLRSEIYGVPVWVDDRHNLTPLRSMQTLHNYMELHAWMRSGPFVFGWLDSLLPAGMMRTSFHQNTTAKTERLVRELDKRGLLKGVYHENGFRLTARSIGLLGKIAHKRLQPDLLPEARAWLDSLGYVTHPPPAAMRYIRFLWHFPCFVFIGLPYYFILNFFQTSRYTYAFRTPIADWHHDDQWYTEGSGGQRKPLGLRERLRRWEEMNWCRQHTISVAVLVSILVLVFAWILYRYL